jgi:hypothetical protein
VKHLHLLRRAGDELAWDAIAATPAGDDVRVVLVQDAALAGPPPGALHDGLTVMVDPAYDQIVNSIEWADRVVTW